MKSTIAGPADKRLSATIQENKTKAASSTAMWMNPKNSVKRGMAININAVPGWGKTSMAAYAPGAAIIMSPKELGYLTLYHGGLVPECPYTIAEKWSDLLSIVQEIDERTVKTLVLDILGGFDQLCRDEVCEKHFGGNWGEQGFSGWQRGYALAVVEWLKFLAALDRVRDRGVDIILLGHTKIETFKNPCGPDYDQYICDMHKSTWGVTRGWVSAALFGMFYSVIEEKRGRKAKGIGGTERVLYTEHRDSWSAKNQHGMPECIDIPNDPSKVWQTIINSMKTRRE